MCPMPPGGPSPRRTGPRAVLAAALLLLAACASDPPTVAPSGVDLLEIPTPAPDPDDFVATVDNPWLPLLPGAEWVYRTGTGQTVTVSVDERTRRTAGVEATQVREVRTGRGGAVVEESADWFAQDRAGNVWHLGAAGEEGSWEAGVAGAEAGVAMLARPRRGDGYVREAVPGLAEDRVTVLGSGESRELESGTYDGLLVLEVTSPLAPGLVRRAHHARGTGLVLEETVAGGSGEAELVGFTPGAPAR